MTLTGTGHRFKAQNVVVIFAESCVIVANAHIHQMTMADLIKVEEEVGEEGLRMNLGKEETAQNEVEMLETPVIGSPNNEQGGGLRPAAFRLPNCDRPFQCSQCGVAFTQKGNLLRHIKLHSGEKPFKCPCCSYACRRRDALAGHLRTHSAGKPYNCNFCGKSYKQRSSLEEHKDRCHNYVETIDTNILATEEVKGGTDKTSLLEAVSLVPFNQPPVTERLPSTVGKRKSTVPQKFVDEKLAYYSYQASLKYEKEAELLQAHIMDHAISNAISYLGTNALRPLVHHPTLSVTDIVPIVNPLYTHMYQLGPQMEQANRQTVLPQPSIQLDSPSSINSSLSLIRPKNSLTNQEESPCNSGTESATFNFNSLQDRPGSSSNHVPYLRYSMTVGKEEVQEVGPGCMDASFDHCITRNVYRVFSREGKEMRTFKCEHCHVLFLDHVMYTIHMGCHGYRNPLECNICGRCSQDRYEFFSHIVRGEHIFH
ncbi:DNA-binding protein Ikaros-like isoform X2 [Paramormyrops kingsleyae]|uniref:DNA-binding protein Ikaros-like isoform X2 n=1 Tax=Paramormyrops kingsleyae TaxID=1676925 RepID=UPI000CD5F98B|nr:zinc finger protein Helios-like isoform X2 [Paramormyrops kingsleyae]XP_023682390.1 zinc finger protein Helios-like isoform X2 [Paramormyrops kingsleyae]